MQPLANSTNVADPASVASHAKPGNRPETFAEVAELCAGSARHLPVGARTKPALGTAESAADVTLIDMRSYCGVVTYDPSEFLISAKAGTTIAELAEVLSAQGQYLPFDPVFTGGGATLGGSIASGISGPRRLLYGGLRDFMLEVQLCSPTGAEVRGGGKVVKNAAGFDLPKLVIGSYGRLGVITEATLKVFPQPPGACTVTIALPGLPQALSLSMKLLALPLPIEALEIDPPGDVLVRLAGPLDSLTGMTRRVLSQLSAGLRATTIDHGPSESSLWHDRAEFNWANGCELLVRVAVTCHQCVDLYRELQALGQDLKLVVSCGATVAWIAARSLDQLSALDELLTRMQFSGVAVRGPDTLTVLGNRRWAEPATRIQRALDPANKLPPYAMIN